MHMCDVYPRNQGQPFAFQQLICTFFITKCFCANERYTSNADVWKPGHADIEETILLTFASGIAMFIDV